MAWPDERVDGLEARMNAGFERVDGEIRELRTEMNGRFSRVEDRFDRMDTRFDQMNERFDHMHDRFDRMQGLMIRLLVTVAVGMLGIIGALLGTAAGG